MKDLITVVIPIYKVENYLQKCIDSVINQTYSNLEIILVDDGSPDNCGTICDEYAKKDARIQVIHKENGGLSDARNVGIKNANGKYITFIDSDDYVTEDYVGYLYDMIKKYNVKLSVCGIKTVWKDAKKVKSQKEKVQYLNTKETFENMLFAKGIEVAAYGKMYLTELWKNYEFPKGKAYEDTAVIYKLIEEAKNVAYGCKNCYYYVARVGSISKQQQFNKNEEDYIKHTEEMLEFIKEKYPELEKATQRFDIYSKFRILRILIFTTPRNKKMEEDIIREIKNNQSDVLSCKNTPIRDKIAIILLNMGLPVFKFFWRIYRKFTGRI